jgi:hypothetical protein
MGKILIVGRLAARDLRHRPAQAVLLLLAITAATATLTLGLALHGAPASHTSRHGRRPTDRTWWPSSGRRPGSTVRGRSAPGSKF